MFDDPVVLSTRFPQKLWRIVNECKTGAIKWGANGLTVLLDYKKFQVEYLAASSAVFKTRNITSFIRQLNLYGFRKVTSHSRDPVCNSRNPDVHEFLHDDFRSGRIDLLPRVCRKTGVKNRARQRNAGLNAERQSNFPKINTQGNRLSRLQLCQLALTKTLEQYTREYRQERYFDEITNYGITGDTSDSHDLPCENYCFDFCLNPNEDFTADWMDEHAVSKCNKCQCFSNSNRSLS